MRRYMHHNSLQMPHTFANVPWLSSTIQLVSKLRLFIDEHIVRNTESGLEEHDHL